MFGYVVANADIMTQEEKSRYKSAYCGLCRALSERYGHSGRMTLTYDMTFLVLVLSSLYEPEETPGEERCVPHPFKKHPYFLSEITAYAADMNVALAYLKLMDDWKDDKNLLRLWQAKRLQGKYKRIAKLYPRQCGEMERCLSKLSEFENSGEQLPDTGAKLFGELMAEIFVYKQDRWELPLRAMAHELGEFIYIMDAVVDLDKDIKAKRFNPLLGMKNSGIGDEQFKEILTMLIGDCTMEFDKLPLVENVSIMRNILCSGVWTKYEFEMARKARKKGETRQ